MQKAFWILGFRKFQIPIPDTNKVIVFHSVLLIPDLLILSFFLDSKQECGIACMLIVLQMIMLMVRVNLFLMVTSLYCVPFSVVYFFWLLMSQWKGCRIWGRNHYFMELKFPCNYHSGLTFMLKEHQSARILTKFHLKAVKT